MRTNCPDVYAAGDMAFFPLYNGTYANIGHWQMALAMGRIAALSILGVPKSISQSAVPLFLSSMFGKSIRYCGYTRSLDDIVLHGDLDKLQFAAFYCCEGVVQAVVTMNYDPLAVQYAALLGQGQQLLKQDIVNDARSWISMLHKN